MRRLRLPDDDMREAVRLLVEQSISKRTRRGYDGDPVGRLRDLCFDQRVDRQAAAIGIHVDPAPGWMKTSGLDRALLGREIKQDFSRSGCALSAQARRRRRLFAVFPA